MLDAHESGEYVQEMVDTYAEKVGAYADRFELKNNKKGIRNIK